jgi:type IV secretion system protein VirB10
MAISLAPIAVAQTTAANDAEQRAAGQTSVSPQVDQNPEARQVTLPAGTEVLLQLKNAIYTRSAHNGDGVYCQTIFPVVVDNITVIPPGTYVKGEIARVQRAGRVKGRAEVLLHFNTVIFPSGYTVDMPGALHGDPGTPNAKTDEEGAVKTDGHDKLKKMPEAAGKGAIYGTVGGTIATGTLNGARIGGGIGAAAMLASVLLTRGPDVRIEPGAALTMRLERPMVVDIVPSTSVQATTQLVPRPSTNRLPPPEQKPK